MVAVIIPALNPDSRLIELTEKLLDAGAEHIIVVNDGSKDGCKHIFDSLAQRCTVVTHAVNLGKGRALKSAFNELLLRFPGGVGAVTADSDGQHSVQDIMRLAENLKRNPHSLILGVRDFTGNHVPWKSKAGNNWSRRMFRWFAGVNVSDTQTGLRGIPIDFIRRLMNTAGERFEFESTMLIEAGKRHVPIAEQVIETIYLENNKGTHFHPWRDSLLIMKVLFAHTVNTAMLFCGSALLSAVIDLSLFAMLIKWIVPKSGLSEAWQLFLAVAGARIISSFCNYLMNRNLVFGRNSGLLKMTDVRSLGRYYLLCAAVMLCSYALTYLLKYINTPCDVVIVKALADIILFVLGFVIQKTVIFNGAGKNQ